MVSGFCLIDKLPLLLALVVDLQEHCIEGSLFSYNLALHLMDSGASAHDHAPAEKDLKNEDRYQNIGVHHILLILFFFCSCYQFGFCLLSLGNYGFLLLAFIIPNLQVVVIPKAFDVIIDFFDGCRERPCVDVA